MDRAKIGSEAEQQAEKFLKAQGLKLIARNSRSRFGEIDLIMQANSTLVFIEVRKRTHREYGGAAASVDFRKQRKLIQTAKIWLANNYRYQNHNCRFDVIAIESNGEIPRCIWYKDAFRPE